MKTVTCWELHIDHAFYLFASEEDAINAARAMSRGAVKFSPADPTQRAARLGLQPIECRITRCWVDVPVSKAIVAFGRKVMVHVFPGVKFVVGRRAGDQ